MADHDATRENTNRQCRKRQLRALWRAAGLCGRCGRARDIPGRSSCSRCAEAARRHLANFCERHRKPTRRRRQPQTDGADFTGMKYCLRCEGRKPFAAFGRDGRRPDGFFPYCRRCRLKDPMKAEAAAVQRAAGLKACYRCKVWLSPEYFGSNRHYPDGLHGECRRCALKTVTESQRRHPEVTAARKARAGHRRRARTESALNDLTPEHWKAILQAQAYRCNLCGVLFSDQVRPTRDHIIPVSKGGGLTRSNVQAVCRSCNSRKGARIYPGVKPPCP